MKHRSNVILILIVAALALAPQVTGQLDEFGRSVVSRAEGAVWSAFMSRHARHSPRGAEAARTAAAPAPSPLVAAAERSRKAAPRAADSSRAAAAQRRPSVEKDASDETARRAEHSFALHPLAPLNLEAAQARLMQQVADGRRVAVLRRFDMPEIPPDALRALAGGAATEKDARRLLRTYERSFRVDSVRGPAPRSNGGGRPAVHVEMSAPPAPERAPKVKGQSRIACAAPAPDAPQPASSVHVETFTNGFSN